MKFKVFLALVPLVVAVAIIAAARTRRTQIDPDLTSIVAETANEKRPAVPAVADENTAADALDALVPAVKARTAPSLVQGKWINSEPLALDKLRGRVVMLDFWTFGCYNCRNTLPQVKRFDERYREKSLTIIGVHTPESGYERDFENLRTAVEKLGIKYPIVTDNGSETWDAFGIEAWPTVIIIDKNGRIRYTHIGEGAYDTQESVIQTLLAE
ncbi:MAG TPA: redoxin family protein [Pyrinomonadaceae bacterium]|nr:redoxin family protein [Pyrinomonadaceae bacterium]